MEGKELVLGGDGRCDSPSFSAKYGSYSFMELDKNVILHIKLDQVHVNEYFCFIRQIILTVYKVIK